MVLQVLSLQEKVLNTFDCIFCAFTNYSLMVKAVSLMQESKTNLNHFGQL